MSVVSSEQVDALISAANRTALAGEMAVYVQVSLNAKALGIGLGEDDSECLLDYLQVVSKRIKKDKARSENSTSNAGECKR